MNSYTLGLLTTPILFGATWCAFLAWDRLQTTLHRHGFSIEARFCRTIERISGYTIRHDIWWERKFGPVFVGGWFRDIPDRRLSRWVGIGSPSGPCLIAYRVH